MFQKKFKLGVAGALHLSRFWSAVCGWAGPNLEQVNFPCRSFPGPQQKAPGETAGLLGSTTGSSIRRQERALVVVLVDDHLAVRLLAFLLDDRGAVGLLVLLLDDRGAV